MLGSNPLEDIDNTRDIRGVMLAGRWFTERDLQDLVRPMLERSGARFSAVVFFDQAFERDGSEGALNYMRALRRIDPEFAEQMEQVVIDRYRALKSIGDFEHAEDMLRVGLEFYPDSEAILSESSATK